MACGGQGAIRIQLPADASGGAAAVHLRGPAGRRGAVLSRHSRLFLMLCYLFGIQWVVSLPTQELTLGRLDVSLPAPASKVLDSNPCTSGVCVRALYTAPQQSSVNSQVLPAAGMDSAQGQVAVTTCVSIGRVRSQLRLALTLTGLSQFANLEEEVSVAGRVMLRRVMGKLAFLTLRDGSASIQIYVDKSILEEACPGAFR